MTTSDAPNDPSADEAMKAFEAAEREARAQAGAAPPPPPRLPLKPEQKWSLTAALTLSLLCPAFFAAAALGTRFGLWDWRFGLGVLTREWGPKLLLAATIIAALAMVLSLIRSPRRGVILAMVALFIPVMMLGRAKFTTDMVRALPPIHDVQTDWSRPIAMPDQVVAMRQSNGWNEVMDDPVVSDAAAGGWPDAVGERVADLQKRAYPDIKPMLVQAPPEVILEFAEGVAQKQGWEIVSVDEETGLIYATDTSMWFGFTDDIVVRVSPQGPAGSRIDARSVSRVGLSDMGANARRLKSFMDDAHMAVRIIGEAADAEG